jgi:hypothetical protein
MYTANNCNKKLKWEQIRSKGDEQEPKEEPVKKLAREDSTQKNSKKTSPQPSAQPKRSQAKAPEEKEPLREENEVQIPQVEEGKQVLQRITYVVRTCSSREVKQQ